MFARVFGSEKASLVEKTGYRGAFTIAYRSTKVGMDLITAEKVTPRKTKIVCTLGPASWSEEGLGALMDAGLNVARFNFSHGDYAGHQEVGWGDLCVCVCVWRAAVACAPLGGRALADRSSWESRISGQWRQHHQRY